MPNSFLFQVEKYLTYFTPLHVACRMVFTCTL